MSVSNRAMKKSSLWIDLPRYDRSYNETTVAELWLNNDERLYAVLRAACRKYKSIDDCAALLEEQMWERLLDESSKPSLWSDLMTAGFARINWQEIVRRNR